MPESQSESNSENKFGTKFVIASKICALEVLEAKILYYKGQEKKYGKFRILLRVSQDDLEAATARLYLKLGVELSTLHPRTRNRALLDYFCPVLQELLATLPGEAIEKFAHWPPPTPKPVAEPAPTKSPESASSSGELVPYDYNRALVVVKEEIEEEQREEGNRSGANKEDGGMRQLPAGGTVIVPNGKRGRSWRVIATLWALSLCLVAGIVGGGAYLLSQRFALAPGGETQIVVTATFLPETATLAPSQTAKVVTETPQPQPTSEATQTAWVITATPLAASATLANSATPAPTSTPAFQLPFSDSFDLGIRPEWLVSGDTLTENGWLATAGVNDASLIIGDKSLVDYQIAIDFRSGSNSGWYEFVLTFGSNLRLEIDFYLLRWYINGDGGWQPAGASFFSQHSPGTLRVQVHSLDATVSLGAEVQTFGFSKSLSGPVTVSVTSSDTRLDNFLLEATP